MANDINLSSKKDDARNSLKDKIVHFINDTVTLDVLTLTGTIQLVVEKEVDDDGNAKNALEFKWDDMFQDIAAKLQANQANSGVSIVAYTHAEWDQDSVNFVATDADVKLVEAHGKTVGAAHEARMNALKSAVEAVEKLFV